MSTQTRFQWSANKLLIKHREANKDGWGGPGSLHFKKATDDSDPDHVFTYDNLDLLRMDIMTHRNPKEDKVNEYIKQLEPQLKLQGVDFDKSFSVEMIVR